MSFQDHFNVWAQKENVEQCANHSFLYTESKWGLKIVLWISQRKGFHRLMYSSSVRACWFIQVISIGVLIYTQFCIMAMSQGKNKPVSQ